MCQLISVIDSLVGKGFRLIHNNAQDIYCVSVMQNKGCRRVANEKTSLSLPAPLSILLIQSISTSVRKVELHVYADIDEPSSPLFRLPPEIRLSIYHAILVENNDSTAILQTCSQIDMEAREVLYQRAPNFDSQAKLFTWIAKSTARNLNRVRTITLRLTDVDLNSLLEDSGPKRRTRSTLWSLYVRDRERLEQSLSALSNLSKLTIVPPQIGHSQLLKNLYHSFLAEIPRRCPRLKQMEIYDDERLLETVPELKKVRRVIFTDSSTNAVVKKESDFEKPHKLDTTDSREFPAKRPPSIQRRFRGQSAPPRTTLNR